MVDSVRLSRRNTCFNTSAPGTTRLPARADEMIRRLAPAGGGPSVRVKKSTARPASSLRRLLIAEPAAFGSLATVRPGGVYTSIFTPPASAVAG